MTAPGSLDLKSLLVQLRPGPQSPARLARQLGCTLGGLEAALRQLQRAGLVETAHAGPAQNGKGSCAPGCGSCSQQSFCSASPSPARETAAPPPELWRLTPRGAARL